MNLLLGSQSIGSSMAEDKKVDPNSKANANDFAHKEITITLDELQALIQFEKLVTLIPSINKKIQDQLNDNANSER